MKTNDNFAKISILFENNKKNRIIIIDKKWNDKCLVKFYENTIK